jgi:hypothetical protein
VLQHCFIDLLNKVTHVSYSRTTTLQTSAPETHERLSAAEGNLRRHEHQALLYSTQCHALAAVWFLMVLHSTCVDESCRCHRASSILIHACSACRLKEQIVQSSDVRLLILPAPTQHLLPLTAIQHCRELLLI